MKRYLGLLQSDYNKLSFSFSDQLGFFSLIVKLRIELAKFTVTL